MRPFLIFLFLTLQLSAQEITLQKGIVIDSLPVNDSISETFALYLPMEFNGRDPLPVIFIFDPQGRGKKAAQLFKPTAEEQGYILAASNDIFSARPLRENVLSAARLINTISNLLPADFRQISVTGLAEGGKVATLLPMVFDHIFGVVPVGEEQLNYDQISRADPFFFIGIVGDHQESYHRMIMAAEQISAMGFPAAVYIFDGGSQWPEPEFISAAVGSLTLHGMKNGLRPSNDQLVKELYRKDLSKVNEMISNNEYVRAGGYLDILLSKYDDLLSLSEIRQKQKHLGDSPNYQNQLKVYQEAKQEEILKIGEYINFMREDIATANFANLGWWDAQKIELREMTESQSEPLRNMGYRLLSLIREISEEKISELEDTGAPIDQQLFANMFRTIFDQQDFGAYRQVISLSAMDGDFNSALFYLEEMLKNGYEDIDALYEIEGTLGLKLTPEFNWLLEKYLGTSRYYDAANPLELR